MAWREWMSGEFPDGFLWGTATAAHQVEGGNTASELWLTEWMEGGVVAAPAARGHYRRMIAACRAANVLPMVTFHHFTAPLWFTRDGGWEDAKSVDRFARYCERTGRALGDLIAYACTINEANLPMMITEQRTGLRGREWKRPRQIAEAAARCGGDPDRFAPYLICNGYAATPNLIAAHRKGYEPL